MQSILVIDVMNLFTRAYCASPAMSSHGYQMGGCVGFLNTLKNLTYDMKPKRIYCVWEGGGSSRRRALYSEYKMNRKPEKLNRFYEDDIPDSEENRKHQMLVLLSLLKFAPLCQLYVSDCEGDDVIAHLCRGPLKDEEKVIVSSDKDMYQLLDDKTKLYNLHKKQIMTLDDVMEEFGIPAKNFALAKALCGDPSDNIPGIKGLGFKTVVKKFPMLATNDDILVQDIIDYATSHINESTSYRRVVESKEDVKRNWRLVYLGGSTLSSAQIQKIDSAVSSYVPKSDRISFMKILSKEGIRNYDVSSFFHSLTSVFIEKEDGVNNV
jgi:DNA polymerase-1